VLDVMDKTNKTIGQRQVSKGQWSLSEKEVGRENLLYNTLLIAIAKVLKGPAFSIYLAQIVDALKTWAREGAYMFSPLPVSKRGVEAAFTTSSGEICESTYVNYGGNKSRPNHQKGDATAPGGASGGSTGVAAPTAPIRVPGSSLDVTRGLSGPTRHHAPAPAPVPAPAPANHSPTRPLGRPPTDLSGGDAMDVGDQATHTPEVVAPPVAQAAVGSRSGRGGSSSSSGSRKLAVSIGAVAALLSGADAMPVNGPSICGSGLNRRAGVFQPGIGVVAVAACSLSALAPRPARAKGGPRAAAKGGKQPAKTPGPAAHGR
jgi:hypothetical protein